MTSWVYILSQFTPEALLFEALLISLLICLYAAFWVLRKRRYGSVDANLPSGPVKSYLNELIANAEHLRLQLFGLLSSSEYLGAPKPETPTGQPLPAGAALVADPEATKKLAQLELKFAEQAKTLEILTQEKTNLEKDLSEARNSAAPAAGGASAGGGGDSGEQSGTIAQLQQKIQDLESRLAEYSVIEDDLANLKRLQQENAQLKSQLGGKGAAPAPATASATPAEAAPPPAAAPAPASPEPAEPASTAESSEPPAESPAPATDADPSADVFETLAGQVESSLQESASEQNTNAAAPSAEAPPAEKSETDNAEADLVAEFEKMLKG